MVPTCVCRKPASPGRLKSVSPQSKERNQACCHCCNQCPGRDDERARCSPFRFGSLFNCQPHAFAYVVKLSSRSFDPLELAVIEVVLDQWADLLVPHAGGKPHLYLLLSEGVEVSK